MKIDALNYIRTERIRCRFPLHIHTCEASNVVVVVVADNMPAFTSTIFRFYHNVNHCYFVRVKLSMAIYNSVCARARRTLLYKVKTIYLFRRLFINNNMDV